MGKYLIINADGYGFTRGINRGIDESLKEYRQGKVVGPFTTAEEFIADLRQQSAKLRQRQK